MPDIVGQAWQAACMLTISTDVHWCANG